MRKAAASSIEQFWWTGDIVAIKKLTRVLKKKGEDKDVQCTVVLALGEYIPKLDDRIWESGAKYGSRLIFEMTPERGLSIAEKARQEAVDALIKTLKDAEQEVVEEAVSALGNIQDSKTVTPMVDALGDRDIEIVKSAIQSIGTLRSTSVRSAMKMALEDLEKSKQSSR